MSAHAYIQYADVPEALLESSQRTIDSDTGDALIQFAGYPYCGVLVDGPSDQQVEFAWSRDTDLRHALSDWFTHHGIHFTVVM